MDFATLHTLGKTELHCHLDGSLSLNCIRQLAQKINQPLPADDNALRKLVQAPENSENLADYLKTFDFIAPLLQTKEALQIRYYCQGLSLRHAPIAKRRQCSHVYRQCSFSR